MKLHVVPVAVLLVLLLAAKSSNGRLQPTQQAGPAVYPAFDTEKLPLPPQNAGLPANMGRRISSRSSSSSSDSKQAAAVSLAGEVLQQLASHMGLLQEQLQQLQQVHQQDSPDAASPSTANRVLLEDSSDSSIADSTSTTLGSSTGTTTNSAATTTTNNNNSSSTGDNGNVCVMWASPEYAAAAVAAAGISTTKANTSDSSTQRSNARKVGSRVNLIASDAWLITWSGLQILQACVQILGTLLAAAVDGVVAVDSHLVLRLVDLGTAFSSGVSYLLYSVFLLNADAVAPWV
jgi:hypothetical protein